MAKVKIAVTLLVVSLILLVIYGADVMVGSLENPSAEQAGFLPFNASIRGSVFGLAPVVMSIVAFAISRKGYSWAIPSLLFVNGGLILIGMIFLIVDGALASGDSAVVRTIASTASTGGILVGLGVWRVRMDTKLMSTEKHPDKLHSKNTGDFD